MTAGSQKSTKTQGVALPINRAFVIQFYGVHAGQTAVIAGRIEHLLSGRRERFHSWKELKQFLARELSQLETEHMHTHSEEPEEGCPAWSSAEELPKRRTRAPP